VEIRQVLLAGALAGCLAGAFNSAMAPLFARWQGKSGAGKSIPEYSINVWRDQTLATQFATLAVYLCAGLVFSLLFWLSWGLAAVGGVSWWQRGLLFALLVWAATCLPLLLAQCLALKISWPVVLTTAIQWLISASVVSLACSWVWQKGP